MPFIKRICNVLVFSRMIQLLFLSAIIPPIACGPQPTFTTQQGMEVFEGGIVDLAGYNIDKPHLEMCLSVISAFMPGLNISGLSLWWEPRPWAETFSSGKSKKYYGLYHGMTIQVGLMPKCYETSLAHELNHAYMWQLYGDSDPQHLRQMHWDIVKVINDTLNGAKL